MKLVFGWTFLILKIDNIKIKLVILDYDYSEHWHCVEITKNIFLNVFSHCFTPTFQNVNVTSITFGSLALLCVYFFGLEKDVNFHLVFLECGIFGFQLTPPKKIYAIGMYSRSFWILFILFSYQIVAKYFSCNNDHICY